MSENSGVDCTSLIPGFWETILVCGDDNGVDGKIVKLRVPFDPGPLPPLRLLRVKCGAGAGI